MSGCISLFSVQGVDKFNGLITGKARQQKAVEIAAQKPDGPLPGIATTEWETLYWAAKEYSVKHAYPEEVFPATGADNKCVLCMQPLAESARARLNAFHDYMENTAKEALNSTVVKLTELTALISREEVQGIGREFKDVLDEIETRDVAAVQTVKEGISRFTAIRNGLLKAQADNSACSEGGHDFDVATLEKVGQTVDLEIEEYKKKSTAEEVQSLKTSLAELEAWRVFAKSEKAIRKYLATLQNVARFENASKALNTVGITKKGKELIGKALTPQLQRALEGELNKLGMTYIPLNLKYSGSAGENVYQMALAKASMEMSARLTEILSEGEQRVIAIAGFLAELNLQNTAAPMVFDDPVCSLDHRFSEKIAARLVQEAKKRQVIVFTHDISFLIDLQSKSEAIRQYCHCINVRRLGESAGVSQEGQPWHAMQVKNRLHFIEQEVLSIAGFYESDRQKYNEEAGKLYGYLRETWEAVIEECLFNRVVGRFQPQIKTLSLREVTVEPSDYMAIDAGMTKCSKWLIGHDLARPLSEDRPAPVELQEDIQVVRSFVSALKTRRKVTESMQSLPIPVIG